MALKDKLPLLRKKASLTQENLALKMNVSRQAISKWESGLSYPDLEKVVQLSQLFDVSTDYLLKEKEILNRTPEILHKTLIDPTPIVRWLMICGGFIGITALWLASKFNPVTITDWNGNYYYGFIGFLRINDLVSVLWFFVALLVVGIIWYLIHNHQEKSKRRAQGG